MESDQGPGGGGDFRDQGAEEVGSQAALPGRGGASSDALRAPVRGSRVIFGAWCSDSGAQCHAIHRILPCAKTGLQIRGSCYFGHLSATSAEVRPEQLDQGGGAETLSF